MPACKRVTALSIVSAILLCIVLTFCSCGITEEPVRILAIGIDKGSGDKLLVTMLMYPSQSLFNKKPARLLTAETDSFQKAFELAQYQCGKTVDISAAQLLMLSMEFAKDGLDIFVGSLVNDSRLPYSAYTSLSYGRADKLLEYAAKGDPVNDIKALTGGSRQDFILSSRVYDLAFAMNQKLRPVLIPMFRFEDEKTAPMEIASRENQPGAANNPQGASQQGTASPENQGGSPNALNGSSGSGQSAGGNAGSAANSSNAQQIGSGNPGTTDVQPPVQNADTNRTPAGNTGSAPAASSAENARTGTHGTSGSQGTTGSNGASGSKKATGTGENAASPENTASGENAASGENLLSIAGASMQPQYMGIGVIKNNRFKGALSLEESQLYMLLTGKSDGGIHAFASDSGMKNAIVYFTYTKRPDIYVETGEDRPRIHLDCTLYFDYIAKNGEQLTDLKVEDTQRILKLEILAQCKALVEKCQKELEADVFFFGDYAAQSFLTYHQFERYKWDEKFSDARFDIDVDIELKAASRIHPEQYLPKSYQITDT